MKIINASTEIITPHSQHDIAEMYKRIETAGRTCYKSEDKITDDSAKKFICSIIKREHEAMLEHASMTVKFIIDRGVSHEIVRHRIASFAQESTRYCNYSNDKFGNEITVIEPVFFNDIPADKKEKIRNITKEEILWKPADHEFAYCVWFASCLKAEDSYFKMLNCGCSPQEARSVLPNSLKTEIIVTANLREWRHFFKLRAAGVTGKPHPQMVEVALPLLKQCQELMPEIFDDIEVIANENT